MGIDFSVVIPAYNEADYLEPTLRSVREQDYKGKVELIDWINRRYKLWFSWRQRVRGKCFVNWTRRVTNYKRFDILEQMMIDPALRKRFLATDIVILMGGRIHQNDNLSQNVMFRLLDIVTRAGRGLLAELTQKSRG